jgi:hypothetical protein
MLLRAAPELDSSTGNENRNAARWGLAAHTDM